MRRKVRYAVVGLGHIAQAAVLPAFEHARHNSELTALVSNDAEKLSKLGRRYQVGDLYPYEQYDDCLRSGRVDAVYIALPNHMHREYTVRAGAAGVHVLCEKPMAVTERECEEMIRSSRDHQIKLMIAYRLHFEEANLKAVDLARSGKLGDLRIFNSAFTMQVKPGDIRIQRELGGGTVYDIGIYCINAARYLFAAEPSEVSAICVGGSDPRFQEVEEMTSAILRFPGERLASFTCSFGVADVSAYRLCGTKGHLLLEPAYEYEMGLKMRVEVQGRRQDTHFQKRDQFAAELIYFSDCVLKDREPEPSGMEGLADVRVIRAIYESAQKGRPVKLPEFQKAHRPSLQQEIHRPPVTRKPELVHAQSPHGG